MNTTLWIQKTTEREKLRRIFTEKAANPPTPDALFEYDPAWDKYCDEMRELERALRYAGEIL